MLHGTKGGIVQCLINSSKGHPSDEVGDNILSEVK